MREEEGEQGEELPFYGYYRGAQYSDALEQQYGVVEGYSHESYIPEDVDTASAAQNRLMGMFRMSLG